MEDPVLPLITGQRVDVEQDLPIRPLLAVLGQRGAPPQAARVVAVLPEVVPVLAEIREVLDSTDRIPYITSRISARSASNRDPPVSSVTVSTLRSRTQDSARSPVTSSSHRYGSSGPVSAKECSNTVCHSRAVHSCLVEVSLSHAVGCRYGGDGFLEPLARADPLGDLVD